MSDAVPRPKFGWRERRKRAGRLLELGLVSAWVMECLCFALMPLSVFRGSLVPKEMLAWVVESQTEPMFWMIYLVLGVPVALLHSALSLAWEPNARTIRAHLGLTAFAAFAMICASFVGPLEAFAVTIFALFGAHLIFMFGPKPSTASIDSASTT